MKRLLTTLSVFAVLQLAAQESLVPGSPSIQQQWIRSDDYTMTWYMMRDTARFEMATVRTKIDAGKKQLTVSTEVMMKGAKQSWIDSTIAQRKTLAPVYHSSYNVQRDMVLHFGKVVKGTYYDKIKKQQKELADTVRSPFFDSNLYPLLTGWLPLAEGYTAVLTIYDFNPERKSGLMKAHITQVSGGSYASAKAGVREVWKVTVKDEISGMDSGYSVYYLDKADRRLWKQEIVAGPRRMEMVRVE